jgi:nicotinate-nucleotide adenylyltransferase
MRLGIFGGTFDPVHYGHLLLAEACREQRQLDEVWFVPAAVPPHKQRRDVTSGKRRIAMLELAIGGHAALRASHVEIERGGVSFTVDTLACVRRQQPDAELFLLMGADTLLDLPSWKEPSRICQLALPVVVRRWKTPAPSLDVLSGFASAGLVERIRSHQVEMPLIELSSTDIRQRVASGGSIRFRTPRAVERYIETHGLYRNDRT